MTPSVSEVTTRPSPRSRIGQRVHVGAQHQHRSGPAAVEVGDRRRCRRRRMRTVNPRSALRCATTSAVCVLALGELGVPVEARAASRSPPRGSGRPPTRTRASRSGADAAHDASPTLTPERRSATAWSAPLLMTRVAPEARARRRRSRSAWWQKPTISRSGRSPRSRAISASRASMAVLRSTKTTSTSGTASPTTSDRAAAGVAHRGGDLAGEHQIGADERDRSR